MPTLTEAFDFVSKSDVTSAQLRVACQILGLDQSGSLGELRGRLNNYLADYSSEAAIVCLNPEPPGSKP